MNLIKWKDTHWKRESITDFKFDYIDIDQFYDERIITKLSYIAPFLILFKTILMYCSDIWTTINLITNGDKALDLYFGPYHEKWFAYVFYASLSCSIILVPYELYKSYKIIKSKDISVVYTNVIAHRLYILTNYKNYCFFKKLAEPRTLTESITFFIYFTLKGWKRFLLVDIGREMLKSYILIRFLISLRGNEAAILERIHNFSSSKLLSYFTLATLAISNILFIITALLVVLAALLYIVLIFKIQGNLKEYCCHEIDKRISKLLSYQRLQRQKEMRQKDMKNHQEGYLKLPSPTLPNLNTILSIKYENKHQYNRQRKNSITESYMSSSSSNYSQFNGNNQFNHSLLKKGRTTPNRHQSIQISSRSSINSTFASYSRRSIRAQSSLDNSTNYYRPPPTNLPLDSTNFNYYNPLSKERY
ncbi:hypothetical protein K502DRAFT_347686 [Neoconidiobolus thromboides FSU 785]|nr:hypothetical protein K502DRAFT_347686 [Neoconidiobolus thromboides FSU 785]